MRVAENPAGNLVPRAARATVRHRLLSGVHVTIRLLLFSLGCRCSLVSKAAEDNEVPTAGYLQEELKKLTFDPDACVGVEDALVARLDKRSSNVKLKTLRLIKLLCESGSPNFRRDMQRRVKEVRECLHWQGDLHPTMGDLPNRMVREAAQQVRGFLSVLLDPNNVQERRLTQTSPTRVAARIRCRAFEICRSSTSFSTLRHPQPLPVSD